MSMDGTFISEGVSFSSGFNNTGNYIGSCSPYDYLANDAVVRVTMGQVVDYFRPAPKYTLCGEWCGVRERARQDYVFYSADRESSFDRRLGSA